MRKASDLRPGDTLVLPTPAEGWNVFGHIPEDAPKDVAEQASFLSSARTVLRLRSEQVKDWASSEAVVELRGWLSEPELNLTKSDVRRYLREAAEAVPDDNKALAAAMQTLGAGTHGFEHERYPDGHGVVFRTTRETRATWVVPAMDDGDDLQSRTVRTNPVALADHLEHVAETLNESLRRLPVPHFAEAFRATALLHDWGKADRRFQALLIDGDLNDAWAQPTLWAKSGRMPASGALRRRAYVRSGLPSGFRHEMLSVQLAELAGAQLPADTVHRDLALHLIAAHHGRARPFAPVVVDDRAPDVDLEPLSTDPRLPAEQRAQHPPHCLDSGIAERFWALTRRFGWWGLAYLEATVRLADQRASQREDEAADGQTVAETQCAGAAP